jgi:hypothetical protein
MRRCRLLSSVFVWYLVASACGTIAAAQPAVSDPRNFDASGFGERIPLVPNWLFAPGDIASWASPTFDDRNWQTVSTDKELVDYGIHDISYAWYRMHIHLRPGTKSVMVGLVGVSGSYEVYANGLLIGGNGNMTGLVQSHQWGLIYYAVPDKMIATSGNLVLAIRFALNRGGGHGRGTSTPLNSDCVHLLSREDAPLIASFIAAHNAGPAFLLCGLGLVAGLVAFALYLALRTQFEYLAISIYLLAASADMAVLVWLNFSSSFAVHTVMWATLCVENFVLIEFVRLVLHLPRVRWLLALEIISSIAFFTPPIYSLGIGSPYFYILGFYLPVLIVKIVLPVLLVRGWIRGNQDAGVLLPAILLGSVADYWRFVCDLVYFAHITPLYRFLIFSLPLGSYQVDFYRLGDFIFYTAVLLFLVLRTVGIARARASVAAELEAARTVQQVLIPEKFPTIPGFMIQSAYKPAGQVGGDFFQILPIADDGALVIVGDVSGKGMPAAMTVSLLVGTVRTPGRNRNGA